MATLVSDLIEDTRSHLYGSTRLELNRVASTINIGDLNATFEFELEGLTKKSIISINDEIMYVHTASAPTKTAVIQRGYMGTTPAAHAIGDIVEINPRFPRPKIKRALLQSINALSPRLFWVDGSNISVGSSETSYPLPDDDYLHIIDIVRAPFSGRTGRPSVLDWYDVRGQDLGIYPSGAGLVFRSYFPEASAVRVRYARKFITTTFNNTTDVNTTIKLAESMNDIPPIDAAFRLMGTKEIIRTTQMSQPEPRLAEEVPPGHIGAVINTLRKLRDDRISEEMITLRERYPIKGW